MDHQLGVHLGIQVPRNEIVTCRDPFSNIITFVYNKLSNLAACLARMFSPVPCYTSSLYFMVCHIIHEIVAILFQNFTDEHKLWIASGVNVFSLDSKRWQPELKYKQRSRAFPNPSPSPDDLWLMKSLSGTSIAPDMQDVMFKFPSHLWHLPPWQINTSLAKWIELLWCHFSARAFLLVQVMKNNFYIEVAKKSIFPPKTCHVKAVSICYLTVALIF